jgi:hypothetical protein
VKGSIILQRADILNFGVAVRQDVNLILSNEFGQLVAEGIGIPHNDEFETQPSRNILQNGVDPSRRTFVMSEKDG